MKTSMNYETEEQKELQKLLVIILIVVIVVGLAYGLSKIFMKGEVAERTFADGEVSTEAIIIGTILNRPETEYFVICYDSTKPNSDALQNYGYVYKSANPDAPKIYYLDLNNNLNKDHYVEEDSNPSAKTVKDMKIKNGTLLRIKRGDVREYIEGMDKIAERLKI